MESKKYTASFFKDNLPEWKRKKDSMIVRHIYRPLSFLASSFFCKIGISANQVSFLSLLVGLCASICYLFNHYALYIVGALLVNTWMILDCADGNIARSVQSEPFGGFLDAASGYILLAFLFPCIGIAAYHTTDLVQSNIGKEWWVFIGSVAGISDILGRLLYQKYLNEDIQQKNGDKEKKVDSNISLGRLRAMEDRIEKEIGLNGILLPFLIIASIIEKFGLFLVLYAVFNLLRLIASAFIFIRRSLTRYQSSYGGGK